MSVGLFVSVSCDVSFRFPLTYRRIEKYTQNESQHNERIEEERQQQQHKQRNGYMRAIRTVVRLVK